MTKRSGYNAKFAFWITDEGLEKIHTWASKGLTKANVAKNIGINEKTFYRWEKEHESIRDAYQRGAVQPDQVIVNALFERARGTQIVEVTEELNEIGELVISKRVTKQLPGDTTAQIFWLKNRRRQQWRDKVEVEKAETVQKIEIINDLPKDEENGES